MSRKILSTVAAVMLLGFAAGGLGVSRALAETATGTSAGPALAHLTISGAELVFPIPDGFCLPQSSNDDRASRVAVGNPIYRCKGAALSPFAPVAIIVSVKNPDQQISATRQAFIQSALADAGSSEGQTEFQRGAHDSDQKQHANVNSAMQVEGADDYAFYFSANSQIQAGNQRVLATTMGAVTVVKGYIILIQFIARQGAANEVTELLSAAKSEAQVFVEDN